jgi:hypothetical protein
MHSVGGNDEAGGANPLTIWDPLWGTNLVSCGGRARNVLAFGYLGDGGDGGGTTLTTYGHGEDGPGCRPAPHDGLTLIFFRLGSSQCLITGGR